MRTLWRFLSGYGFAVVLLGFLLLLTFLGTFAQVGRSLFEVQKQYFESLIVMQEVGPVSVPLPGVALLLGLLSVNLVAGGLIRIRKRGATAGVIIAHIGIVWMLVAGLVEFVWSTKGHMTLAEGERSAEYVSFFEWEIALSENGGTREYVVPGDRFVGLPAGEIATFHHPEVPLTLAIDTVYANADVVPGRSPNGDDTTEVNGYQLVEQPPSPQAERHKIGCFVTVAGGPGGAGERHILWSGQRMPLAVRAHDGALWLIDLRRRRWPVPFTIVLEDFRKEDHPGTAMARSYESDVSVIEGAPPGERVTISMNNPLRHRGFTLFQSSWDQGTNGRLYSQFSVVENPADKWPEQACWIIAIGLVLHFVRKLFLYVRKPVESRA